MMRTEKKHKLLYCQKVITCRCALERHRDYEDEDCNVSFAHPSGWADAAIDIDSEGMHGFMGVSYQENKL